MKTILNIYKELYADNEKWDYYSNMQSVDPFDNSEEFIRSFIELSGKSKNILYEKLDLLDKNRRMHIVSTFFIGIFFYYHITAIKTYIDKILEKYKRQNPDSKIEFSYFWFLICLFHDLGYSIENKNNNYSNFDDFLNRENIKYFLRGNAGVPNIYKNVYKNYFQYRIESSDPRINKPDHGICGGIVLFDSLNKTLKKELEVDDGLHWNLRWDPKLKNIFNYVSWVILAHNIWLIPEGDKKENVYKDPNYNLQELIYNKVEKSKIDIKKYPFLFLLSLADTIEPLKNTRYNFSDLGKIQCEIIDNNKIVFQIDDETIRADYYKKVKGLNGWLIQNSESSPNIKEMGINQIKITI